MCYTDDILLKSMEKESKYKNSGVDVEKTDSLIDKISPLVRNIGGFGGLFDIGDQYLVGSTDGVGTKIILAQQHNKLEGIGIDCVAMCVNDVLCTGAKPLFFLDYFASSNVIEDQYVTVINSLKKGCDISNMSFIGGETAELPSLMNENHFDIAGFCVGIVDKDKVIDGKNIVKDDVVIGLPSNGFHSNGYSLVRNWLSKFNHDDIIDQILKPTEIYSSVINDLLKVVGSKVKGLIHITGGGFSNINRILPNGLDVELYHNIIRNNRPNVFNIIQKEMNISNEEMNEVFNNGVGILSLIHI